MTIARASGPRRQVALWVALLFLLLSGYAAGDRSRAVRAATPERLRVIIETDAGGDPDDEQSLVRFLLYANEWDIEGIIANRAAARDGENRNRERTGLAIVRRQLAAYGECHANLIKHDPHYPSLEQLEKRTVAGYDDTEAGVELIIAAVDADDPRPLWYSDWGTDRGGARNNLRRALDRVLRKRGPEGYATFKRRLRLASADAFGEHTDRIGPPFVLWVDTFRPELDRKRWYHRFSGLTATAGGFDVRRDLLTGHGPLGELYPLNTTHPQKEGDSMTFLYLVPTGMNDPEQPAWGSWAGRYGRNPEYGDHPYYWANAMDSWGDRTHRDNTVARWAVAMQHDFAARADWCVASEYQGANHAPVAVLNGDETRQILPLSVGSGDVVRLASNGSRDPDGQDFATRWYAYPEAGTYRGEPTLDSSDATSTRFVAPVVQERSTIHVILELEDKGTPSLFSYRRAVVTIEP